MIGVEFEANTTLDQLTVLELKLLIHLAPQQFEEAHDLVGTFLQYNENTVDHGFFYQAMNVVLDEDLELADYEANFRRMLGNERMDAVIGSVEDPVRFHGLTPTSIQLEGLVDSYKKAHEARAKVAGHSVRRFLQQKEKAARDI